MFAEQSLKDFLLLKCITIFLFYNKKFLYIIPTISCYLYNVENILDSLIQLRGHFPLCLLSWNYRIKLTMTKNLMSRLTSLAMENYNVRKIFKELKIA